MFNIPDKALRYILFQRTAYLTYQNNRLLKKLVIHLPFFTYKRAVSFEARVFKGRIKRLFAEDISREYENIKSHLPGNPRSILDIGCGVAGIDIMLGKHYTERRIYPDFYLLDKTQLNADIYYGIEDVPAYYNALDLSKSILEENGIDGAKIHTQEVNGGPMFPGKSCDLVISLLSWGFHYPVSTYLDEVHEKLAPGGRLIMDVRKGNDGEQLLTDKFGSVRTIGDSKKTRRILAVKS